MAQFSVSIAFSRSRPAEVAAFYEHRLKVAEAKIRALEAENKELKSRANNPRIRSFGGPQLPNFG